ncbi:PhzF family phenazine biosynthesis protein [Clostridium frigoris]|uniref:PhzF family phenazine biosynthesis protein n=1 Tax=Clostridium frigoris TaxID=205327 RepID=A0ABS6BX69_9CLOT|nr:PhzF family phenazine biosynthesis protein [Clostridium frigoris]MBU3161201.1 PhzF family phenazine biosynthesis protein [Clostridium frigoris]
MINIYQVNAFTNERFKCNPSGVCDLDEFSASKSMLNLAKENYLNDIFFLILC